MKKIVILTGATGGLGREFFNQILKEEIDEVWAIARNEQKLSALRNEYGNKVVPIPLDLSDCSAVEQLGAMLKEQKPTVSYLINNAGLAKMGKDMSVCSLYVKYQHLIVKLLPQRWVMKIWMMGIGMYLKEN